MSLIRQLATRLAERRQRHRLRRDLRRTPTIVDTVGLTRIQYASAEKLMAGWLNVDLASEAYIRNVCATDAVYRCQNLIEPHPFADDTFEYGFGEDFLEHLEQDEAIIFLCEAYRTFKPGGVLRLSTPSLEGVLARHYRTSDYGGAVMGQHEAYRMWGHLHFFAKPEIQLLAEHIGFAGVHFEKYGQSRHEALRGIDTREHQADLNLIVELTK